MLKELLSDAGYSVTLVGRGGLALAQVRSRQFEVVIIDLSLPDEDGMEVIRRIRSEYTLTPILAISGFMVGNMPAEVKAAGATDTLLKPVSPDMLLLKVSALIEPRGT